jgi:hypothetical protein
MGTVIEKISVPGILNPERIVFPIFPALNFIISKENSKILS